MSDEKYDPQTRMTYIEGSDGKKHYVDARGETHSKPSEVIAENQRIEGDLSQGTTGGCGQDASKVPDPSPGSDTKAK